MSELTKVYIGIRARKELKHDLKWQRPGELKSVLKIDPCSLASGPKIDRIDNPLIIMSKSRYILLLLVGGWVIFKVSTWTKGRW